MTLKIQRLTPTAVLPERATGQSAGLDLRADIGQAVTLPPGGASVFPTGLAIALPEGTVGLVFGRSGLGIKHGIAPSNAVGVIDADYRGECTVALHNDTDEVRTVAPGDRIAQLVILPFLAAEFAEADALDETDRGAGGFGSTGR